MIRALNVTNLKRGLLLFWALYFTIVLATNVTDAFSSAGWAPKAAAFASGNFSMVRHATETYFSAAWLPVLLFAGVVLWEAATAILFWRALRTFSLPLYERKTAVYNAFSAAILLFSAFILTDEFFILYHKLPGIETTHLLVLSALLLSLLVAVLLPEE